MPHSVERSSYEGASFAPRVLIVRVTEGCNAGCFMCSFARQPVQYMWTIPEVRKFIAASLSPSIQLVRLTGGEPLLLPHLPEILRLFSCEGVHTSVITNGWFLEARARELIHGGLEQCILSVDGATSATHDRYRRTPGLFQQAFRGVEAIRHHKPSMRLRVNTVVGPHNIEEIEDLFEVLRRAGIAQWSIIPMKGPNGTWSYSDQEKFIKRYEVVRAFLREVNRSGPIELLGYSAEWAGRSEQEVRRFVAEHIALRPRRRCEVPRNVLYYTPQHQEMTVCNCVVHRDSPYPSTVPYDPSLSSARLRVLSSWFHERGSTICRGCEPVNAAFGDGCINLQEDPFAF